MSISWKNVILSWVNVCAVCSDHINTSKDLSDGKLLECFVPSCTKNSQDNYHQKTIKFIQRQYPRFWTQIPSELQNEDLLIIYSLLIHYYSFIDDPSMRNKMCSLSNASQIQIKRFLEFLCNKDITKHTVQMAIQSCCESPVQSLIKFFENLRNESKTPLDDFLKVKSIKTRLSYQKRGRETCQETRLEMPPKIYTEIKGLDIMEHSSTSAVLTVADNKVDKDSSLEWDYTDVFEDLSSPVICDSTTVDTLPEEAQNINESLLKELSSLCLERDSLRKEFEEKNLILHDLDTKITLLTKEINLKNGEIISKEKEVEELTNVVQSMSEENLEMSKKVNLLQDEFNKNINVLFEKAVALKTDFTELKMTTIHNLAGIKSSLESMTCENDILRNDNLLLEKKLIKAEELITELKNKILSLEEDLIAKEKVIDNLMNTHLGENVSLQTKISDEQVRAAEVLQKYTHLKFKYIEKARECADMKRFYEEKWSHCKEQFCAAFKEEKEQIITEHNSTVCDLENSLELYKKKFIMCHDDATNLRKQVWDLHEKLLKQNEVKAKLETQLSLLNRNKAKREVIGEKSAFLSEQHCVEDHFLSREQGLSGSIPTEVVTNAERSSSIKKEQIYSRTDALPQPTEGNNEFNARSEDLKAGRYAVEQSDEKVLAECRRRNSMVLPHLKSSYPVTHATELRTVRENEIKFASRGDPERRETF